MATLSRMQPGQKFWVVVKQKMGNTTMSGRFVFDYIVKEIDFEKRKVLASWNGNPALWYNERSYKKWLVKKPEINNAF